LTPHLVSARLVTTLALTTTAPLSRLQPLQPSNTKRMLLTLLHRKHMNVSINLMKNNSIQRKSIRYIGQRRKKTI
jgi:hypothetical protein